MQRLHPMAQELRARDRVPGAVRGHPAGAFGLGLLAGLASDDKGDLPTAPSRKIAVLACMDARLNPYGLLGLQEGDAHVICNAGGVMTDDEIRSLTISQRLLGTEEIILTHHTDCGMLTFTDDEFKRSVQDEVGIKPEWAAEAFGDLDEDAASSTRARPAGCARWCEVSLSP